MIGIPRNAAKILVRRCASFHKKKKIKSRAYPLKFVNFQISLVRAANGNNFLNVLV